MGDMRERMYALLPELMETNQRLVLLLADIGMWVFREVSRRFPDRYFNMGISEQAMIGAAAGLAMEGYYPVMFTWTPFITELIVERVKVNLAARGLNAILISASASYEAGYLGPTHECPGDVGALYNIPDVRIAAPGNEAEFEHIFTQATENPALYYIRLTARENSASFFGDIGHAHLARVPGDDPQALVIACGETLEPTARALRDEDVRILYYPWVRPFDENILAGTAEERILVVEPWYETLTMPVMAALATMRAKAIVKSASVPRRFIQTLGWAEDIDVEVGLDKAGILKNYLELVA